MKTARESSFDFLVVFQNTVADSVQLRICRPLQIQSGTSRNRLPGEGRGPENSEKTGFRPPPE